MTSSLKYYLDENVPRAIARGLRRRGVDVLTTPEAGMLSADDDVQLAFAAQSGRVLFTQDDDFLSLPASFPEHHGIAFAAQGKSIGNIITGLIQLMDRTSAEEMRGRIEFV